MNQKKSKTKKTKKIKNMAKKNEIVVSGSTAKMIEAVDAKIASFKHISDSTYKTSMNLEGFGSLKEVTSVATLVKAYHSVKARENGYYDAANDLGITTLPAFEIGGGNAEAWAQDIKLRIQIIQYGDTMEKLKEIRKGFESLMTNEDRKENLLEQLKSLM